VYAKLQNNLKWFKKQKMGEYMRGNKKNVVKRGKFSGSKVRQNARRKTGNRYTRKQVLKGAGVAAAGLGAAAVGLGKVARAQVVPTGPDSCEVYPTGISPTDVNAIQEAVDNYTNVILKAHKLNEPTNYTAFNLGVVDVSNDYIAGYVRMNQGVNVQGESKSGFYTTPEGPGSLHSDRTVIYGGGAAETIIGEEEESPDPWAAFNLTNLMGSGDIVVDNLMFYKSGHGGVLGKLCYGATISNNIIKEIIPLPVFYNVQEAREQGYQYFVVLSLGISFSSLFGFENQGFQIPYIEGDIIIEGNEIDHSNLSATAKTGIFIGDIGLRELERGELPNYVNFVIQNNTTKEGAGISCAGGHDDMHVLVGGESKEDHGNTCYVPAGHHGISLGGFHHDEITFSGGIVKNNSIIMKGGYAGLVIEGIKEEGYIGGQHEVLSNMITGFGLKGIEVMGKDNFVNYNNLLNFEPKYINPTYNEICSQYGPGYEYSTDFLSSANGSLALNTTGRETDYVDIYNEYEPEPGEPAVGIYDNLCGEVGSGLTFAMWAKPDEVAPYVRLIELGTDVENEGTLGHNGIIFNIGDRGDGRFRLHLEHYGNGFLLDNGVTVNSSSDIDSHGNDIFVVGEWHHYAVTVSINGYGPEGAEVKLYKDGKPLVELDEYGNPLPEVFKYSWILWSGFCGDENPYYPDCYGPVPFPIGNRNRCVIGRDVFSEETRDPNFKGQLDEIAIWDKALSPSEIAALGNIVNGNPAPLAQPSAFPDGLIQYFQNETDHFYCTDANDTPVLCSDENAILQHLSDRSGNGYNGRINLYSCPEDYQAKFIGGIHMTLQGNGNTVQGNAFSPTLEWVEECEGTDCDTAVLANYDFPYTVIFAMGNENTFKNNNFSQIDLNLLPGWEARLIHPAGVELISTGAVLLWFGSKKNTFLETNFPSGTDACKQILDLGASTALLDAENKNIYCTTPQDTAKLRQYFNENRPDPSRVLEKHFYRGFWLGKGLPGLFNGILWHWPKWY
jgi:hypothetical protein